MIDLKSVLLEEIKQLEENFNDLQVFQMSNDIKNISSAHRMLIDIQLNAMATHLQVLLSRIELLNQENL